MIYDSLSRMRSFIKHHPNPTEREVTPVVEKLWRLINTIYAAKWDLLHAKTAFNRIIKHDNDEYPISSVFCRGGSSSHHKYTKDPTSSQQER